MDTGLWTLRCQHCDSTFTLELTAGQRVEEFAKSYNCPECKVAPDSPPVNSLKPTWHHVIGFKATK